MKYEINDPRESNLKENTKINYGDLFEWTELLEHNVSLNPVMYTFEGLVSLSNPRGSWEKSKENIEECLNEGELRKLPPGYSITIIQE